jgi:hypothetical protein
VREVRGRVGAPEVELSKVVQRINAREGAPQGATYQRARGNTLGRAPQRLSSISTSRGSTQVRGF